jgi:VCBS repeat-containing protein
LYAPDVGFVGEDSFTYAANDGQDDSNVATITITVTPAPNEPPVAAADSYSTVQSSILEVPAPGVLGNDSDADNNSLTATLVSDVSFGLLTLFPDGSFVYMPDPDFVGEDSFTYVASDSQNDSKVATVTITVTEGIKHILVDIMPGTEPNLVDLTAQGVVLVLILGSADCDVTEIDVPSILLEGQVAPLKASVKTGAFGYKDLKLRFDSNAVNEVLAHLEVGQTYEVRITGALVDGTSIGGSDSIMIVEPRPGRGKPGKKIPDKSKDRR